MSMTISIFQEDTHISVTLGLSDEEAKHLHMWYAHEKMSHNPAWALRQAISAYFFEDGKITQMPGYAITDDVSSSSSSHSSTHTSAYSSSQSSGESKSQGWPRSSSRGLSNGTTWGEVHTEISYSLALEILTESYSDSVKLGGLSVVKNDVIKALDAWVKQHNAPVKIPSQI